MIQIHAFYSGIVQGVGFRYTVRDLALRFAITGWVRNLSDGRVEVLAEGEETNITQMLSGIEAHFKRCIRVHDINRLSAQGEFKTFSIIH